MKSGKFKAIACLLLLIYMFSQGFALNSYALCESDINEENPICQSEECKVDVSSRILELLIGNQDKNEKKLLVGGDVFGIRINECGVTVTDCCAGSALSVGDRITAIDGVSIQSPSDIEEILHGCGGKPLTIEIIRAGEHIKLGVTPKLTDGKYRLGISLRKNTSGLGTVTFIDPETGIFGGLGHGVSSSTGELIEMESGEATTVILGGIKKGEIGKPGELSGVLGSRKIGTVYKNSECGIFGVFDKLDLDSHELMSIGHSKDLRCGEAEIISTVKNGRSARYKIEITDIDYSSNGSKSFKIKLTDPVLIALTGGIVRGMSGSPIIQNGKIVGAVTHVMVANPTEGYGIFIENMLSAASDGAQPKAA